MINRGSLSYSVCCCCSYLTLQLMVYQPLEYRLSFWAIAPQTCIWSKEPKEKNLETDLKGKFSAKSIHILDSLHKMKDYNFRIQTALQMESQEAFEMLLTSHTSRGSTFPSNRSASVFENCP